VMLIPARVGNCGVSHNVPLPEISKLHFARNIVVTLAL
jgi:hypothetical protein